MGNLPSLVSNEKIQEYQTLVEQNQGFQKINHDLQILDAENKKTIDILNDTLESMQKNKSAEYTKNIRRKHDAEMRIANGVRHSCNEIHETIKKISVAGKNPGKTTLLKLCNECKYMVDVEKLLLESDGLCVEWSSGAMKRIIHDICLNVLYTYRIFQPALSKIKKNKPILDRLGRYVNEMGNAVMKPIYRGDVTELNQCIEKKLRLLYETGKTQTIRNFDCHLDQGDEKLVQSICELVTLKAGAMHPGWSVEARGSHELSVNNWFNMVIYIDNIKMPESTPDSSPESIYDVPIHEEEKEYEEFKLKELPLTQPPQQDADENLEDEIQKEDLLFNSSAEQNTGQSEDERYKEFERTVNKALERLAKTPGKEAVVNAFFEDEATSKDLIEELAFFRFKDRETMISCARKRNRRKKKPSVKFFLSRSSEASFSPMTEADDETVECRMGSQNCLRCGFQIQK